MFSHFPMVMEGQLYSFMDLDWIIKIRTKFYYYRSILTVPWIELGGTVTIECAATGYKANIEFLTKPFYGGKKHRVTCEAFGPGDKKPFLTAQGEWNSSMIMKWTDTGVIQNFNKLINKVKIDNNL